jgi:hypothetical protein
MRRTRVNRELATTGCERQRLARGRLRYEVGLGAKSPPVARSAKRPSPTTSKRAAVAGLSWPLPADCDDRQLAAALFGFSA